MQAFAQAGHHVVYCGLWPSLHSTFGVGGHSVVVMIVVMVKVIMADVGSSGNSDSRSRIAKAG